MIFYLVAAPSVADGALFSAVVFLFHLSPLTAAVALVVYLSAVAETHFAHEPEPMIEPVMTASAYLASPYCPAH